MNALVKQKWLRALRSGEYVQCRGQMCKEDVGAFEFDPLGVLCEVCGLKPRKDQGHWGYGDGLVNHVFLPEEARKRADLGEPNPSFMVPVEVAERLRERSEEHGYPLTIGEHGTVTVTALNDAGFTFEEIADLIERYL